MRAYVITTGSLFALLVIAHVARVLAEGMHMARDPWFAGFTLLAAAVTVWACLILRRLPRR